MRLSALTACGMALMMCSAFANDPTGEWLVKDATAQIKIDNCDGAMWGVVSWERQPGGRDTENPDPAKRDRPTLGLPILLNMKPTRPDRWDGEVYNAQNGKTYTASITLLDPDSLRIEGCVFRVLCGGETWTRVAKPPPLPKPRPQVITGRVPNAPTARQGQPPTTPDPQAINVCLNVLNLSGPPHQGGLK